LLKHSEELIGGLKEYSVEEVQQLMKLSEKLGQLNYQRFQTFDAPFTADNAKQAIFTFSGDVYDGLDAASFTAQEHQTAQQKIRMLSGLYGLLRPQDFMQAYRLEMGTRFANARGKNLYEFWGAEITNEINNTAGSDLIINLASNEYFKAVKTKNLQGKLVTVHFKEFKDDAYKIIGLFAKRARGMMARHIVQNNVNDVNGLLNFDDKGYMFNAELSTEVDIVFTR
jgi:cytoplasmic iron level regulating protein YaaA (DUF328/UPF0246 family)